MRIPYVIDNIDHQLADVLNDLLARERGQVMDIASAYFSIRGFEQLRTTLPQVSALRLLLGQMPESAQDIGVRPDAPGFLRGELNAEPLSEATVRLVEDLIRFLRRPDVQVHMAGVGGKRRFLHAKCYLLYGGGDHFRPRVAIVGSSNFTGPGLTSNMELNLVHKTLLDMDEVEDNPARDEVEYRTSSALAVVPPPVQLALKSEVGAGAIMDVSDWYNKQWVQSTDFKETFIEILENSKFGGREYTPYEVYLKALYEYFRDDLDAESLSGPVRSAVELSEFQDDAVKKARRILARYDGVIIGDSVGLGKTWIGKKLLEDRAYHLRQKAVVVCPAALRNLWERELRSATIAGQIVTQEQLGQKGFDGRDLADADVILVDEAHNFRNRGAQRYQNLEMAIAANGRRGRDGGRKKVILLTATPINNNIFDLYNQINLFTGGDRTYFAAAGIGDLYNYFLAARRASAEQGSVRIFNLMEEVVVRRTRQFIKRAYPDATIQGKPIRWPERRLQTVHYDLEATYKGFYSDIVRRIDRLNLAPYNLETFKTATQTRDDFELGRQEALVGIFKSRFLKRLESSIDAFRISIRRALEFTKTFAEYVQDDILLDSASFQTALRLLEQDDEDSSEGPVSRAEEIDASAEARALIDALPRLDASKYDRRQVFKALTQDIDSLTTIWHDIQRVTVQQDAKLQRLMALLGGALRGQKVLIFTYYKDTARYLHRALTRDDTAVWRESAGSPVIERIDSSVKSQSRLRIVEAFAPEANKRSESQETTDEIDVLIATDVLSEGQNLQDCGCLINYDLHWNPTRMVQRAGRIDRLGSAHDTLLIANLFPEQELENLLGLVRRLTAKIDTINQTGFLDASVLGEVVTPRDFNTLKRIADEDQTVIDEQESFIEMVSSEALLAELQKVLATQAREWVSDLDDGIHSALDRSQARGVFFYFIAHPKKASEKQHFWRYYDLVKRQMIDNRYEIMQLITCHPDTPRAPTPGTSDVDIYDVQERVVESILRASEQQQAVNVMPKIVSEEQIAVSEILGEYSSAPGVNRDEIRALRKFLKQPLEGVYVSKIRAGLQQFQSTLVFDNLLEVIRELQTSKGPIDTALQAVPVIKREDLHLICYEYILS